MFKSSLYFLQAGLGVAEATELRSFQPFFVSLSLPYAVIRDEDVTLPTVVFSYLQDTCITIKVSLEFSEEYKMIHGALLLEMYFRISYLVVWLLTCYLVNSPCLVSFINARNSLWNPQKLNDDTKI